MRFLPAAELTPEALAAIAEQVRIRVLRWFARSGLIERDDVREMLAWANSGFSLDAAVRVGAYDRSGLERLLRYCARPPFALERLERLDAERVVYRLPKPQRNGITALTLTPLELIDHLAALIPPPRRHRHRYHGVLAPKAPLRAATVVLGRDLTDDPSACAELAAPRRAPAPNARSPARYLWAMLLARLFESMPLTCPNCGADMRIIAFISEAVPVEQILTHIGDPPRPPPISPACGPPAWNEAPEPMPDWDLLQQPEPDFEFDQRVAW
ncbi:transposase [Thiorhodovibrio frisius]|uniref:transposase n=1 Tax=Thiorhodovibrio frisius TaxID=631362 RepID=UPI002B25733A|nr:transposase [Thiorhodovibrio frisius]WPL22773.1 Putative transposase [Thiorhodovibrio frisius]